MKVKVLKYCQHIIDGRLLILDANSEIDVSKEDANSLIENCLAVAIEKDGGACPIVGQAPQCENKMINLIYKKPLRMMIY